MPSTRRNPIKLFVFLGALVVICSLAWISLSILMSTSQTNPLLPEPDPRLGFLERTYLGTYLLLNKTALEAPAGDEQALLELEVIEGQTAAAVIDQLNAAAVVENPMLLRTYLQYSGYDRGVEAGLYYLYGGMSIPQIAHALQTARSSQVSVTIPEGWRLEQIANQLVGFELGFTVDEFLIAAQARPAGYSFSAELPDPSTLEGFLFPDTYLIEADQGF